MSSSPSGAAAAVAGGDQQQQPPKKKRVQAPPVVVPPSVSTAYLILRGIVNGLVGASMEEASVSLLQPTFLKDSGSPTGKFTISLGKKLGTLCQLNLPESHQERSVVLETIQQAANRIVQEALDIQVWSQQQQVVTKQDAVAKFGVGILDGSHKRVKDDHVLTTLAYIDGFVLAALPSLPFCNTNAISSIIIEQNVNNSASCIVSGGRKAEITIKFRVVEKLKAQLIATPISSSIALTREDILHLYTAKIRLPEGQVLLQAQQQEAAAAMKEQEQDMAKLDIRGDHDATAKKQQQNDDDRMVVNIETVSGKIDYNKLVEQFGSKLIGTDLLQKLEQLTVGQGRVPYLHRFLRRDIFFSHRDLSQLLDCVVSASSSSGNHSNTQSNIYLYTGRGPSSTSMHLGHLIPFLFTQWLQQALDCPCVIQMTDDEKFLFKGEYTDEHGDNLMEFQKLTMENARDIIACGFDPNKTFVFSDLDYVGRMYPNICRIWKSVTTNSVNGIFGFDGTCNIGKIAFPAIQAAPSFASSFPTVLNATRDSDMACLIPCAIDQDPYFRMTRDVAHKLTTNKQHKLGGKPALIHSKFFPPLQGATGKMSSSDSNSAIFLTDSPDDIKRKINQHCFSGGQDTKEKQSKLGADLQVDVAYQWLRFFLEDDEELEQIGKDYASGSGEYWSTGKVKQKLISVLQELVAQHQERRAAITDEEVRKWMKERCIL